MLLGGVPLCRAQRNLRRPCCRLCQSRCSRLAGSLRSPFVSIHGSQPRAVSARYLPTSKVLANVSVVKEREQADKLSFVGMSFTSLWTSLQPESGN